jgi:hypothetical protein
MRMKRMRRIPNKEEDVVVVEVRVKVKWNVAE